MTTIRIDELGDSTVVGWDNGPDGFARMDADRIGVTGTLALVERAASGGDAATLGQIWVKNETPCELWFTDDDGTDVQLGLGGGTVGTFGSPIDDDFAKFTDATTIEGRSYSEVKTDLSLNAVENTALSTWVGTANITTLGTITTGTWTGTDIAVADGGTGASDASTARTNLGVAIGSDVQAWSATLDATTASYTSAEETKLSGIETAADVTDTANVTSSGALMDSEVSSLSGIKSLTVPDSTTISAFAATVLDDASAAAQRTTLGVDSFASTTLGVTVDGAGSVVTAGSKGLIRIPFDCTIDKVTMLADASGTVYMDIEKSTYAGFPTNSSICASAKPSLSAAQKSEDATLTGWTTAITAGDVLEFEVEASPVPTTITRLTLILDVTKT